MISGLISNWMMSTLIDFQLERLYLDALSCKAVFLSDGETSFNSSGWREVGYGIGEGVEFLSRKPSIWRIFSWKQSEER